MSRRFISQLGEHESVDEVFIVAEKQLRTNRNGNLYLTVRLADKTGSMTGMMWNANDRLYSSFDNGDYLQVQGTTQFYNGALQMIVSGLERASVEKVDESDFVTLSSNDVDRLAKQLGDLLRGLRNYHLRNLAECFLVDDQFMAQFTSAPAGIKLHHAYRGGLVEHTISLIELCRQVAPHYPTIDSDLLQMGAFVHDIGKVNELSYERDLHYTDAGQLIGHVIMGVEMLDQKVRETERLASEPFPEELHLRLKHMIVSHHGQYDFGSPKLPMTLEAVALHFLDSLDSKIHSVMQIIRDDANSESSWTPFQPNLGRKLYKGGTE